MPEDEPPLEKPITGDRTETERLATAGERAAIEAGQDGPDATTGAKPADAEDAADVADTTDMSAVGDDGQVFGG